MAKKTKKAVKKTLKVEIVEPEVEVAPETYKQDPAERPEPTLLPSDPTPEPEVNPNEPKRVGIEEGFKRPSIVSVRPAYTKKQYQALMDAYKEQNPAKYQIKKSELESKLSKLK